LHQKTRKAKICQSQKEERKEAMPLDTHIIIDIETVADKDQADKYFAEKNFTAPARFKDEKKILAYVEAKRQTEMEKAALKPWLSKVICIGWQIMENWKPSKANCFYGDDEKLVLTQFAERLFDLELTEQKNITLWGYNSLDFDFPFLYSRYLAHDMGVPAIFGQRYRLKDVKALGLTSAKASLASPLNDRLFLIGSDGKIGAGNQVANWYADGMWDTITKYCMDDTAKTTEILRRSRPYKDLNIYQG
jgi:predicted PolB exonuclease-like 3'-5' exonuclease